MELLRTDAIQLNTMDITLRSVARDDASAERWHTEVRKTDRPEIGSSDLAKLVLRATAPLMSTFVPLTLSKMRINRRMLTMFLYI